MSPVVDKCTGTNLFSGLSKVTIFLTSHSHSFFYLGQHNTLYFIYLFSNKIKMYHCVSLVGSHSSTTVQTLLPHSSPNCLSCTQYVHTNFYLKSCPTIHRIPKPPQRQRTLHTSSLHHPLPTP